MLEMMNRWYKRRFSDPHAVSLVAIILFGFITIYFFGHLIAPLLVAIVLAYLLEWPVTQQIQPNTFRCERLGTLPCNDLIGCGIDGTMI